MSNKNFNIKSAVLLLSLFAAAMALVGVLYRQSRNRVQQVSLQEPILETVAVVTQSTEPPEVSLPQVSVPTTPPEKQPSEAVMAPIPQATEPAALKTGYPVSGDTIGDYAMDCLSYNETTRDWRIHNGIDLAAESGSPVCAAADGTVYTTYEDDTMGHTVVIRHPGGYTTRYSSLSEDLCVQAGDKVTLGQTIGYASDSALVETVMGSHVHFSVSYQDQTMDPAEFFALG